MSEFHHSSVVSVSINDPKRSTHFGGSTVSGPSTGRSQSRFYGMQKLRRSIMFQDKGARGSLNRRFKTMIIRDGKDVAPKNLGNLQAGDLFDDDFGDQELFEFNGSLWGETGDRSRRSYNISSAKSGPDARLSLSRNIPITDMDSVVNQMSQGTVDVDDEPVPAPSYESAALVRKDIEPPPFIKIIIRETEDIHLFERNSVTVPADSDEALRVEADNKAYDHLTIGKGRARRTSEAEAQTSNILYKSRSVNTDRVRTHNIASYVSNFDMFDTYAELERITRNVESDGTEAKIAVTTYSVSGLLDDPDELLSKNENFKLSSMVIQRLLAGNNFRERQKRFRNMTMPSPLDLSIKYLYSVRELWTYQYVGINYVAVSSLSWCRSNGDLLAIGYGVYGFVPSEDRSSGYVCVWSIKNPKNPERIYRYGVPVTAVAFARETPQLLAVGLYDGSVEVLDITDDSTTCVAKSQRTTSPGFEPVWKIEWILVGPEEELLTISEDGLVMRYSFTSGPHLLGFRQIKLDRVEGAVEGLVVPAKPSLLEAYRSPQALTLQIHPLKEDIFYVGTEEGCVHRCSTFYPHQYSGVQQVHRGSVSSMEFSPWSPKIFLTCGSDWKTRIWIEDIFEPVLVLSNGFEAYRAAYWSPMNSTVIVCITKQQIELWNIRKNVIKPASVTQLYSGNIPLTTCSFSPCGRSLIVGDRQGTTHVCALDDMPFPPHFQYEELQAAIYQGLLMKTELLHQVKSLGFLGYNKDDERRC